MLLKPGQDVGAIICTSVLLYVCVENVSVSLPPTKILG